MVRAETLRTDCVLIREDVDVHRIAEHVGRHHACARTLDIECCMSHAWWRLCNARFRIRMSSPSGAMVSEIEAQRQQRTRAAARCMCTCAALNMPYG
jgi:hypothetical protein